MDAATGRTLFERDATRPLPPASTTKVLTAIVALESGKKLTDLFRVSREAARAPYSKLLRPGQVITLEDLLYSLLLMSANDAGVVLAEGIAGSVERFAEMMTQKAREIGAMQSRFRNPHGLTAAEHYSTARDMALIFKYAMGNPVFREIIGTKSARVETITAGQNRNLVRRVPIRNHNRLLWSFEGAIGGKTGYTLASGRTFVGAASRNGVTLIVSLLGSRDLWGDARKLLDYGFEHYEALTVASSARSELLPAVREKGATRDSSPEAEEPGMAYIVQVASFLQQSRAKSLERRIQEAGFPAFLERVRLKNGKVGFRVKVGPFPDLIRAEETAIEVERISGVRAVILPVSGAEKQST